jgi:nucleotide-binding universal stress UspA family protein
MIRRILVGLGGSEYTTSAVRHAVQLAAAHDAEITGISVIDENRLTYSGPVPLGGAAFARHLAEDRLTKAKERAAWAATEFLNLCQEAGARHELLREVADPFAVMIERARYHDVMVFGLRSLFEYDLVDDPHDALVQLVQSGVRPILAVSREYYPVKKVLVAYSGSMESAKAMKRFAQLQLWRELEHLRIITFEEGGRNGRQLLEDAAHYFRVHGFQPEVELVAGSPMQLLSYSEEWGADMTVVGNSARNLLLRRIFGETALNVIRNANRPLFLAQ